MNSLPAEPQGKLNPKVESKTKQNKTKQKLKAMKDCTYKCGPLHDPFLMNQCAIINAKNLF